MSVLSLMVHVFSLYTATKDAICIMLLVFWLVWLQFCLWMYVVHRWSSLVMQYLTNGQNRQQYTNYRSNLDWVCETCAGWSRCKDCLRSIVKRLRHRVPHVAMQALTVSNALHLLHDIISQMLNWCQVDAVRNAHQPSAAKFHPVCSIFFQLVCALTKR